MAQQTIAVGTAANDGTGDPIRTAFTKVNANFTDVYSIANGATQKANNLSDLGSASTARTNLGLGALAVKATINNADWSGTALAVANGGTGATSANLARVAINQGKTVLTAGATVTMDCSLGNYFTLTPNQNFTFAAPLNPQDGATYVVKCKQGATPYTISWAANTFITPGGSLPALTAAANAIDVFSFVYDAVEARFFVQVGKDFK